MSSLMEHEAEQAAITAMCDAGTCQHPECHAKESEHIEYKCPSCGESSIYATDGVSIYWDSEAQEWAISDDSYPCDEEIVYCGNCAVSFELEDARVTTGLVMEYVVIMRLPRSDVTEAVPAYDRRDADRALRKLTKTDRWEADPDAWIEIVKTSTI